MLSTYLVESTRIEALKFFNADPEYFDLVFVANATAAIKMVADCMSDYCQQKDSFWYGYHADAHTSLVGIRQLAHRSRCFRSDQEVDKWLSAQGGSHPDELQKPSSGSETLGLFAFPGQSNMNGRRLPLSWPRRIRSAKFDKVSKVYSLLDAAALVATSPLNLSDHENAPDFTALSFYKIFGFPDLGALIVRKASGHVLSKRRYFGGGTVDMVVNGTVGGSTHEDWYARKTTSIHEMLEDGTPAFHSIIALNAGLRVHKQLFGSMTNVSLHCASLAKFLYEKMASLTHANGLSVCQIYKGSDSRYGDSKTQGPTIAFNLRDSDGELIGKSDFETLAILNNIQIRTGGLCNPGGIASSLQITPSQMRENFEEGVRCGNEIDQMHGKPTGVIRVSLGAMSSQGDISEFLRFLQLFVSRTSQGSQDPIILRRGGDIEKPGSYAKSRYQKIGPIVDVVETSSRCSCPIASCRKPLESREEISSHLSEHKAARKNKELVAFQILRNYVRHSLSSPERLANRKFQVYDSDLSLDSTSSYDAWSLGISK